MRYTREQVLERLHRQLEQGQPIIGAGAGTGISAKFAEAGGEDAAAQLIRPLGGGHVEGTLDEAVLDEALHRLPAGAGGVEHQHLVALPLEDGSRGVDQLGGVAEHARGQQRLFGGLACRLGVEAHLLGRLDGAADGAGGVGQHRPRQPVDAGDVDDRVHHRDVLGPDVGAGVPRGDGRDHQLRHADRQGAHGAGADRGPGRAADRDDAVEPALGAQPRRDDRRAARHRLHGRGLVAGAAQIVEAGAAGLGDRARRHVGRRGRVGQDADVDQERLVAARGDLVLNQARLGTLGVEGGDYHYVLHGRT